MKIEILPQAEDDIIRQFRYYLLEQNAPLVALAFRSAVRYSMNRIQQHPRIGSKVVGISLDVRSWPVRRFQAIRIYYTVREETLRVVRVLHSKREIRRILARLSEG